MDLHGNIEIMLFSDKLEELERMDLNKPVAFKVYVTKNDSFTRIRCDEIMSLEEAKKQNVQTKIEERYEEPLVIKLDLSHEIERLEELYHLALKYPGKKPLKLVIVSKLQEVEIESQVYVSQEFAKEAEQLGVMVA